MNKEDQLPEIIYRKLERSDIEKYHEIRLKCLQEHPNSFGSTYEEEIKKEKFKFDEFIAREDAESFMLGAFKKEECIGICGFIREEGKRTQHRGHLVQIYVKKQYQAKGIGSELISRTIMEAFNEEGLEQILLGVITENEQANRVYERLGFKEYGRIKEFLKLEDKYLDKRMMIRYKER
ncbi:MAG: GNAT family protein [Bacteroidia bacterium]|nr:GNAT family protein [Bacteroidia bacterium]